MIARPGTAPTVACPVCGAAAGERCRGRRGPVDYHYRRREAARVAVDSCDPGPDLFDDAETPIAATPPRGFELEHETDDDCPLCRQGRDVREAMRRWIADHPTDFASMTDVETW